MDTDEESGNQQMSDWANNKRDQRYLFPCWREVTR